MLWLWRTWVDTSGVIHLFAFTVPTTLTENLAWGVFSMGSDRSPQGWRLTGSPPATPGQYARTPGRRDLFSSKWTP